MNVSIKQCIEVRLTFSEVASAMQVGGMRHLSCLFKGWKDKHGADSMNGWQLHVEGACGEVAAAKALNMYWPATVNTFDCADLGERIQIKTRSNPDFDLIVRQRDSDHHYFVLVTGVCPVYNVCGFLLGAEAKQEKWIKDYGNRKAPAYFVPQKALKPISDLAVLLREEVIQ
jgi:hypothetical protein